MTDWQLAQNMRRLNGEICTPVGMKHVAKEVKERGLMRFVEWPSGHWSITERGQVFLSEVLQENHRG